MQIANITVKAANGTTDVVYDALIGASANEPAIWANKASSPFFSNRDTAKFRARENGNKTARWVEIDLLFPIRRIVDSVETVVGVVPFRVSAQVPNWATDNEMGECIARSTKFLDNSTIKSYILSRYAPTA